MTGVASPEFIFGLAGGVRARRRSALSLAMMAVDDFESDLHPALTEVRMETQHRVFDGQMKHCSLGPSMSAVDPPTILVTLSLATGLVIPAPGLECAA